MLSQRTALSRRLAVAPDAGFDELAFVDSPPFGVGANRLSVSPQPFRAGVRLFEFVGYDVLAPDLHATRHSVDTVKR